MQHNKLMKFVSWSKWFFHEIRIQHTIEQLCEPKGEKVINSDNFDLEKIKISQKSYLPDFILQDGCAELGIPAMTAVDVKLKMMPSIFDIARKQLECCKELGCGNLLYVFIEDTPDDDEINLMRQLSAGNNAEDDFNVHYTDLKILCKNANFSTKWGQTSKEEGKVRWDEERDAIKEQANISYNSNKCTLFIGAGVSMSAGLPSWNTLLKGLLEIPHKNPDMKFIKSNDYESIDEACGHSSIISGHYVTQGLDDVPSKIHEVLYKDYEGKDSDLINSICDVINGGNVESVITYNYDDILEECLTKKTIPNVTIYGSNRPAVDELPVYHVHGYIPRDKEKLKLSPIVLSEREYHRIYREAYHWSNVEQLHALNRTICFFIGLSMTDPNLRRLCDIAMSVGNVSSDVDAPSYEDGKEKHFAFLKRESFKKGCENCPDCSKSQDHYDVFQRMMSSLGISVIWYENYEDLPSLIRDVFKKE